MPAASRPSARRCAASCRQAARRRRLPIPQTPIIAAAISVSAPSRRPRLHRPRPLSQRVARSACGASVSGAAFRRAPPGHGASGCAIRPPAPPSGELRRATTAGSRRRAEAAPPRISSSEIADPERFSCSFRLGDDALPLRFHIPSSGVGSSPRQGRPIAAATAIRTTLISCQGNDRPALLACDRTGGLGRNRSPQTFGPASGGPQAGPGAAHRQHRTKLHRAHIVRTAVSR